MGWIEKVLSFGPNQNYLDWDIVYRRYGLGQKIFAINWFENHEGARHRRKPLGRRSMGFEISTVIIIYIICFAFTHSNIDFQKEYQEPCIHFQNVFRNGLSFSECDLSKNVGKRFQVL